MRAAATVFLLFALFWAGTAAASPQTKVDGALRGGLTSLTDWSKHQGKTWDVTRDNQILRVVHTPMSSWGTTVASRAHGNRAPCTVLGTACGGGTCQDMVYLRRIHTDPTPRQCGSHSDAMLNEVWTLIQSAQRQVDLTTLFDPSGELDVAVRNGIQFAANELDRTGATHQLLVRVLLGEQHAPPWAKDWLVSLGMAAAAGDLLKQASHPRQLVTRYAAGLANTAAARLKLVAGVYHPSISIWNHAKIIAVDGKRALVGGHNLWAGVYTQPQAAVHDLSLLVDGSAARSAHAYANVLWDVICSWPEISDLPGAQSVWRWDQTAGAAVSAVDYEPGWLTVTDVCEDGIAQQLPPEVVGTGAATVYAVGKTGTWSLDWMTGGATGSGQNPADDALAAMIDGASTSVMITQQDVRGPEEGYALRVKSKIPNAQLKWLSSWLIDPLAVQGTWTRPILAAIAKAAARGVPVKIVISDPDNLDGAYHSAGAQALLDALLPHWPSSAPPANLCNLQVVHLRDSDDHGARNHPKAIIVDAGTPDAGFYIGSQNLYGNDLAEYGYIVFDPTATGTFVTGYWNHAWRYSAGANDERVYRGCGPIDHQRAAAVYGQPAFTSAVANAGGVRLTSLDSPTGVAFLGAHKLLGISDANNARFVRYDFKSTPPKLALLGQPSGTVNAAPLAIAEQNVGKVTDGNRLAMTSSSIVLADTARNRVLAISTTGGLKVAVLGQPGATTGGAGTSRTTLNAPTGVWTDGTRIAVADTGNNRVLLWDAWPAGHGAAADRVIGQANDTTQAAQPASQATLNAPRGVTFDGTSLYVADSGNHRVMVWSAWPSIDGAAAAQVIGQSTYTASAPGLSQTAMNGPVDVEVHRGMMVVADAGNHRLLVYAPLPGGNGGTARNVIGQPDFTTAAAGGPTQESLNDPRDVTIDGGKMFVADRGHHRVLEYRIYAPR